MPAPTANAPDVDLTRQHVVAPVRRATIGDRTFYAGDADIRVRHNGSAASFRVALWNLSQATWRAIAPGDDVRIEVGWKNAEVQTVLRGQVEHKDTQTRGEDYRYLVTGRSDGARAVRERLTASWEDATTHSIVRDIARRVGLSIGYLGEPAGSDVSWAAPTFDGYTQIRRTKRVRAWLDEFARRAGRETGHQFEWYVDRGAVSFHAKRDLPPTIERVTTADEVLEMHAHNTDTQQTNDVDAWKASAFCTPTIRRQATLELAHTSGGWDSQQGGQRTGDPRRENDDEDAIEQFRVARYQFETGTTIGHHLVRAILVPTSARYEASEAAR